MKNKIMILGALMLSITSCHKDSDIALNYAYEDIMAFSEAKESFAGEFLG